MIEMSKDDIDVYVTDLQELLDDNEERLDLDRMTLQLETGGTHALGEELLAQLGVRLHQ